MGAFDRIAPSPANPANWYSAGFVGSLKLRYITRECVFGCEYVMFTFAGSLPACMHVLACMAFHGVPALLNNARAVRRGVASSRDDSNWNGQYARCSTNHHKVAHGCFCMGCGKPWGFATSFRLDTRGVDDALKVST